MRSPIASTVLAAAFVIAPLVTGYAPALAQDFSITDPNGSLRIEGAELSPDWIRKLQAFWDLHAYYPKDASDKDESGVVKVNLRIHSDGQVWWVKVEHGSGSKSLDNAAFIAFYKQFLPRFPAGTRARQADVFLSGGALTEADVHISLHYVLAHRHDQPILASTAPALSKQPFTITNGPVKGTVVETMQRRTCTGEIVTNDLGDTSPDLIFGSHDKVTAVFYRKPDGTPWVKWYHGGGTLEFHPVTELGLSAQWNKICRNTYHCSHYAVWSDGNNRLSGRTVDPPGSINLTCETEILPVVTSNPSGNLAYELTGRHENKPRRFQEVNTFFLPLHARLPGAIHVEVAKPVSKNATGSAPPPAPSTRSPGSAAAASPGATTPVRMQPVRVRKNAFAPGVPQRDPHLSPDHAVSIDGALIPIRYLINAATIVQEDFFTVAYWHVELPAHAVLLAEELPCESYLDTGNRGAFAGETVRAGLN